LFVIAVMAIVVIGATLQINELLKREDRALADDVSFSVLETDQTLKGSGKATPKSSTSAESQQQNAFSTGTTDKQTEAPNAGVGERKSSAGESEQRTEQLAQKLSQALSQAQSLARQAQQSQSSLGRKPNHRRRPSSKPSRRKPWRSRWPRPSRLPSHWRKRSRRRRPNPRRSRSSLPKRWLRPWRRHRRWPS